MPGRRGELKYLDVNTDVAFSETGSITLLNGCAPGTGASQRIGKKIVMKSINVRLAIAANIPTGVVFQGTVRMIIFFDKQTNAAAPLVTDVLEAATGLSNMRMDNRERFVVLSNQILPIDQSGGNQSAFMKCYKKLNLPVIFNAGVAGTVADIQTGALYMLRICEQSGPTTPGAVPVATLNTRIRFDDS